MEKSRKKMSKPWNDYSDSEKVEYFYTHVEDCSFLVGMQDEEEPKIFKAYKFVLSSVSSVFERMFNGDFKEAKMSDNEPIAITDIYACDFEVFLYYVRSADPFLTRWKKLYDVAKKYMADDVIESLIKDLQKIMRTPDEALQFFDIFCDRNEDFISIRERSSCFNLIKSAVRSNYPYILRMSPKALLKLLKLVKDQIDGSASFQTISKYCAEHNSKPDIIELFMKEVNFSNFNFAEYFRFVANVDMFDLQTKYDILVKICRYRANF